MRKIRRNPEYFVNALLKHNWDVLAFMEDVDEMEEYCTTKIVETLDSLAPKETRKFSNMLRKNISVSMA